MSATIPVLARLVANSIEVSKKASAIIRDIMAGGDLQVKMKGVNDPQTESDRAAQRLIIASLQKSFPKLRIIGEEGEDLDKNVPSDWLITRTDDEAMKILQSKLPESLKTINEDEIVVWVDPLDGTTEYTQGFVEHVTVLIGISAGGKAVGGIINQPFFKSADGTEGRTIWGVRGLGVFGLEPKSLPDKRLVVTTTRSHSTKAVQMALDALKPDEILRVGGAGYKVLQLIEGKANAYVFPSPGCKKWDTCAPEAVLEALGGQLTDIFGNHYDYHADVEHPNRRGVLATREFSHENLVKSIPDEVKAILSEKQ